MTSSPLPPFCPSPSLSQRNGLESCGLSDLPFSIGHRESPQATSLALQDLLESAASTAVSTTASVLLGSSLGKCLICGAGGVNANLSDNGSSSESTPLIKVLACCHCFCIKCLESEGIRGANDKITCPQCHKVSSMAAVNGGGGESTQVPTTIGSLFGSGIESPFITTSVGGASDSSPAAPASPSGPFCQGCKSKEHSAVARCHDCTNYLCPNCVMAHQFMHCFEGHRVVALNGAESHVSLNGGLDSLLSSVVASVDRQQVGGSCSPPFSNNQSSPNGSIGSQSSSGCLDPTQLVSNIQSETSLAPGGPVAGKVNGISPQQMDPGAKVFNCPKHKGEGLKFFCFTCDYPICKECVNTDHGKGHEYNLLHEVGGREIERIVSIVEEAKGKAVDLRSCLKSVEHASSRLQLTYQKAQNDINETHTFYKSMLDERKLEALKELDSILDVRQVSFSSSAQKMQEASDKLFQTTDFMERLLKHSSMEEILLFKKTLTSRLYTLLKASNDVSMPANTDIEFVSNFQAIQIAIRNTYGYLRQGQESHPNKQVYGNHQLGGGGMGGHMIGNHGINNHGINNHGINNQLNGMNRNQGHQNGGLLPADIQQGRAAAAALAILNGTAASNAFNGQILNDPQTNGFGDTAYEKWSAAGAELGMVNPTDLIHQLQSGATDQIVDLTSKLISANIYPPKSQIKRQKMIYHCKFGEFGVMEGQFTEPSGVAVNAQNDIVVADTNNHRIQIFDKEGRFKFQFGECGKRDGQLLYPNRVAVVKPSGDIIVTERSPTHQIQIYNQYGQFVRKFGANILQHPRGVTVDSKGRIIIVECKVMRVIIFDQMGNVLNKFGCSKHLEFPNGVVVNDRQEIFISDNRAHCVKVFNYEGQYLRQVGGEGITNYPIGVGINAAGEILIADNHNNFNLTIFTQDGQLVNALESKVKHAQCFDVALMDDGTIVLASKDYRIYLYRYIQLPGMGL